MNKCNKWNKILIWNKTPCNANLPNKMILLLVIILRKKPVTFTVQPNLRPRISTKISNPFTDAQLSPTKELREYTHLKSRFQSLKTKRRNILTWDQNKWLRSGQQMMISSNKKTKMSKTSDLRLCNYCQNNYKNVAANCNDCWSKNKKS